MPNTTRSVLDPTGDDMDTAGGDLTQRVRNAASAVDESRSTAADGLDTAASALHDRADDLPGGETVRNLARTTADRLSASADYVRSHDAKRMMADVETFVKSNPGPALVVAAAFGFLLARSLSKD